MDAANAATILAPDVGGERERASAELALWRVPILDLDAVVAVHAHPVWGA
jgi:hypothetical protein